MSARYRQLALDSAAAQSDPDRANRIFREEHAVYKRLRETLPGRAAISQLLDDEAVAVRLAAATHSLAWDRKRAERILEEIERGTGPFAMDAKWTLRSYRNGTLDLDW